MGDKSQKRIELEAQAINLGIAFAGNIGDAKLAKRIEDHKTDNQPSEGVNVAADDGSQPQKAGAADAPAPNDQRVVGGGLPEANTIPSEPVKSRETSVLPQADAAPDPLNGAPGVSIVGPKRGRWRAGRHFTAEPTVILIDDLSEDEGLAILSDPELKVAGINYTP